MKDIEEVKVIHDLLCGFRVHEYRFRYLCSTLGKYHVSDSGEKLWACELSVWWSVRHAEWGTRTNGDKVVAAYTGRNYLFPGDDDANVTEAQVDKFVSDTLGYLRRVLTGEEDAPPWV